ncbi:hypothetical protein Ahy_A04g017572 [Arachis hypogaea]|uniref:Uncharacterized protein n=1 Tax=Arachis hypogaea TaxID=3818 RepID=A0A445DBJ2_ARAHY|nr:hypothetical protein Ahy_A04g017572 [Arachis hypogaea]
MCGSRVTLVIEKTLHDSDLNPQQNRLLIPSQHVKKSVEKHRANQRCQWFQCRLCSSSSDKNKLKEPLVDFDDSTLPFSSKKKAANAFSYCLESEGTSHRMREETNKWEKRMMNIKGRKRGYLMQYEEYDFNDHEFEVVDILDNLPRNFLERLNLETSDSTVNSSPQCRRRTGFKGGFQEDQRNKKTVNQEYSELPQNFKNLISDMGGSSITLVIKKTLYDSDLDSQQNELLIPS